MNPWLIGLIFVIIGAIGPIVAFIVDPGFRRRVLTVVAMVALVVFVLWDSLVPVRVRTKR